MHQIDPGGGHEVGLDLLGFAFAQQAVIDEDAGQPVADGPLDDGRRDGGIDPSGQATDGPALGSELLADIGDGLVDDVDHGPGGTAAGGAQEVLQHLQPLLGVHDLGVELHSVEAARRVLERGHRGRGGGRGDGESLRRLDDRVAVGHPDLLIGGQLREEHPGTFDRESGGPVFSDAGRFDPAAERIGHHLVSVADAEHRDAGGEQIARRRRERRANRPTWDRRKG